MAGERDQIAVAEALPHDGGLAEHVLRGRDVAVDDLHERRQRQAVSLLHAIRAGIVQQPAGAREPSAALGELREPSEHGERQPVGAPRGADDIAAIEKSMMRARPCGVARGVFADEICDRREAIEILGIER